MTLVAGNELQLMPAGSFKARDGRPLEVPAWHIDTDIARMLIAAATVRATPYVIDYDHQTLLAKDNGQPSPAAGWFKTLEWRDGTGLFAIDVEWTARAQEMIAAGEYKFVSPVFGYDDQTGNVNVLLMAAITNNPAIDGMEQVLVAAASLQFSACTTPQPTLENPMDELLEQLRWLLNLPVGATAADIEQQLQKLIDTIKQDATTTAAASFDITTYIASQRSAVVALTAATPDPAKYVPVAAMTALQQQVAALSSTVNTKQVDDLVNGALAAGKLLPAQEAWARDLGVKNIAALSAFIETAPALAILGTTQTSGTPPAGTKVAALSDNQLQLCKAMGVSPEEFLKTQQDEQTA